MGHLKTAPPHPPQCAHWDSLPLLAPFGRHFPLTGGISLPPGEDILTPNPPAQNRRPVINVICNSTHVTIPDINITWESNPTHGPARCQYYVPICSGTGSVTPAFCAAKKSIFNFQPQSRAAPCISPAARPGGCTLQSVLQRAVGHMGPSLRFRRTALITGSASLIRSLRDHLLLKGKAWRAADSRPYRRMATYGGRVRTPAPTRMQGRSRSPPRGRSQTGPRAHTVRPYGGKQPRDVGSETAGAKAEPHQLQFSTNPGPGGPEGIVESHSYFARRK